MSNSDKTSNFLSLDFETKSTADLGKVGGDNYSKHPSTDALCVGFAFDDEAVDLLRPEDFFFAPFLDHVAKGGMVRSWNVPFELAIWNNVMVPKYGWPTLDPAQCVCVMAMSYAMALPGKLENAAPAAGIEHRKDMAGHRLMLQLSQPRSFGDDGEPIWWEDKERLERLYAYCKQDIEVERQLFKRLMRLSPQESALWQLDYQINQRGVQIDVPAVKRALKIVQAEAKRLDARMQEVTMGAVGTCKAVGQLSDYLKWMNVKTESVDKESIVSLLADKTLPSHARDALVLRQEAGKSSTAKLETMLSRAGEDGRLRGMFQYHGANTGRWAGRGAQPQNYPRPKTSQKHLDSIFQILESVHDA